MPDGWSRAAVGPAVLARSVLVDVALDNVEVTGPGGLLERLTALTDPRSRHGRRHALAGVLAVAAAAVLGGARSYAAAAELARELPQETLARLGIWQRPYSDWYVAPSETTLRRVLQQVDADELDRVVGCWLAAQQPSSCEPSQDEGRDDASQDAPGAVAVDGKTVRLRHEVARGEWLRWRRFDVMSKT